MKALTYKTSKTIGKEVINVTIKLADDCKNGHQDFSITGELYQAGKPKNDKYMISCGCIHDDILKFYPEFKNFVDLHLADYRGIPMYAVANGYYHLKNGFNNAKPSETGFKETFCNEYRITADQFDKLSSAESELHFALLLRELGIYEIWKIQADKAIAQLEQLTGDKFEVDNPKDSQGKYALPETYIEEKEKLKNGYYSVENKKQRQDEQTRKQRQEIIDKANAEIDKIKKELNIKLALFDAGGKEVLESAIYYNHTNEIHFNWYKTSFRKEYTQSEADEIMKKSGLTNIYKVK